MGTYDFMAEMAKQEALEAAQAENNPFFTADEAAGAGAGPSEFQEAAQASESESESEDQLYMDVEDAPSDQLYMEVEDAPTPAPRPAPRGLPVGLQLDSSSEDEDEDGDAALLAAARNAAKEALAMHDVINSKSPPAKPAGLAPPSQEEISNLRKSAIDAAEMFSESVEAAEQKEDEETDKHLTSEQEDERRREKVFKQRELKRKFRELREQNIFAMIKPSHSPSKGADAEQQALEELLSGDTGLPEDLEQIPNTIVTAYIGARDAQCPAAQTILRSRRPHSDNIAKITTGMFRLEEQLGMLPQMFAKGLLECSRRDPTEKAAVANRVKEIRAEYLVKLHQANERLAELHQLPHDLTPLENTRPYQMVAAMLDLADSKNTSPEDRGRTATIAQQLQTMAPEGDEDGEEDGGNFNVLASMGLLSQNPRTPQPRHSKEEVEANPFVDGDVPADPDQEEYVGIKSLLKELDQEMVETMATVSTPIEWATKGGTKYTDFLVTFSTDDSTFDVTSKSVRRTYADCKALFDQVSKVADDEPLDPPDEYEATGDEETDEGLLISHLDELGMFITNLAEDPDYNSHACVHKFLLSDDAFSIYFPAELTNSSIEDGSVGRSELAEYPVSHLKAIAKYYGIDVARCVTLFEYADGILVGRGASAALPTTATVDLDESTGEGFRARKHSAEERRRSAEDFAESADEEARRKLDDFRNFCGDGPQKLPLTVGLFLEILDFQKYQVLFEKNGYDDLRVVTSLTVEDLVALDFGGLTMSQGDSALFVQACFEWTVKAAAADVVANWSRELHRAGAGGFYTAMSQADQARAEKMRVADEASAKKAAATGKPVMSADGTHYIGPNGKMELSEGDEVIKMGWGDTRDWDPTPVLKILYDSPAPNLDETNSNSPGKKVAEKASIEGYLDKLPRSATLKSHLKRWARRFFRAHAGELFYFKDNKPATRASGNMRLLGSTIRFSGNNILEIIDAKSNRMILRTSSTAELEHWKSALDKEANPPRKEASAVTSTAPRATSFNSEQSQTLIFDIGGCSVRAGFCGASEDVASAWPQLYMPAVSGKKPGQNVPYVGINALRPSNRVGAKLSWPLLTSEEIGQGYGINDLEAMYSTIYGMLEVDAADFSVAMTEPQLLTDKDRARIAEIMFEKFSIPALYMKPQPLLAMYSYGATTGVIVDIGERLDVIPLNQGYLFPKGVTHYRYGGAAITNQMQRMMTETGHRFFSHVESYIARLVKERVGFVTPNYAQACVNEERGEIERGVGVVDCRRFNVPDGTKTFKIGGPRFRAPEGLFEPNQWGKDNLGLPALVHKAIMSAPIDVRKEMARNVYLSGGATKTPGLAERLKADLEKLLPSSSAVTIHQSQYCEHAAYRGAAVVAGLDSFERTSVDQDDYHEVGESILRKFMEDSVRADGGDEYSDDDDDEPVRGYSGPEFNGGYMAAEGGSEDDSDASSGS